MQLLSFVIAFSFLGLVSVLGALMVIASSRRLLSLVGGPGFSLQSSRQQRMAARVTISLVLLALGLFILAVGIRGIYRVIWVTQ